MNNQPRILIVDDEPDILLIFSKYAENNGWIPFQAVNGQEALDSIVKNQPDAIISDIMMPKMDGMELLRRIKALDLDIPVILMTAYGTIDRAVEAMKLGAADFITKPVNMDYVLQVIKRVFKQSELEHLIKEHERQLHADLQLASLVQRCMLPAEIDNPYLRLCLRYEPLIEIGGDYLAIRQYSEKKIAVALYDVSGHGVSAALLATMLHHELTDLFSRNENLHEIIRKINFYASEKFNMTGLFCTMILIWIDTETRQLTAVNAGHPSLLLWKKAQQKFEIVSSHIPPIGIITENHFESHFTVSLLAPGDRIILYTDGFTESRYDKYEFLGEEGFMNIARQWIDSPPKEFMNHVFRSVAESRDSDPHDDQTLVVIDLN